jgi:lipoate-protein ligase A
MAPVKGRYLPAIIAPGAIQMALDTWLLTQQIVGTSGPLLRFYTWSPAALSLGYHQRQWPQHWSQISWQGQPLSLVRRPSGGRAVLHQGELTYAIAIPLDNQPRQACYRRICDGLIAGWQQLGIDLHYGTAGRGYIHRPDCFGTATPADLVTPAGFKLIGSAQLRREHALLQHGSMRLWTDPQLYEAVFGVPLGDWRSPDWLQQAGDPSLLDGPAPQSAGKGQGSLEIETGRTPLWQPWQHAVLNRIINVLRAAIAQQLDIDFSCQPLTAAEWQTVQTSASTPLPL